MSKKFTTFILILTGLMGVFSSCGQNTGNDADSSGSPADSIAASSEAQDPGNEVTGVLLDATMNTAVMVTESKDTLSFATGGVEMSTPKSGIRIGDTLTVTYEGDLDDRSSFPMATAKKVVVRAGKQGS